MSDWIEVKPIIIKDTWKTRYKKQTGYMPRPQPIKIHPDKKKKKVMMKNLFNMGWGSKQLALWFKEKQVNVYRWVKAPTPENLMEFEKQFQMSMKDYDNAALYKVKERMMEIIPEEENLQRLVSAGNFFKGTTINKQTNIQNNLYGDLIKKFSPTTEAEIIK
jgi:hypothetical protein